MNTQRFQILAPMKLTKAKGLFVMYSSHKKRSTAESALKRIKKHVADAFIRDTYGLPERQVTGR